MNQLHYRGYNYHNSWIWISGWKKRNRESADKYLPMQLMAIDFSKLVLKDIKYKVDTYVVCQHPRIFPGWESMSKSKLANRYSVTFEFKISMSSMISRAIVAFGQSTTEAVPIHKKSIYSMLE